MEVKPKEAQLSVERVPGTLSTASKSVQVNGAATVSITSPHPLPTHTHTYHCVAARRSRV